MKPQENYNSKIVAALLATIRNEATAEQQELIKEWLESSKSNRELYAELCDSAVRSESVERLRSYDKQLAWAKIMAKIANKRRRKVFIRIGQVAAAVVLVASVCSTLYMWQYTQRTEGAQGALIMPGSPKATITFADGRSVALDTASSQKIGNAIVQNSHEIKFVETPKTTESLQETPQEQVKYNTINVPRGGEYKVSLSDGSVVYLNSQTTLRFAENFTNTAKREIFIEGEGFFEVAPDASKPFVVHSGKFTVEAIGTSFNITNYADELSARTTVASGSVKVSNGSVSHKVAAGEQAVISPAEDEFAVVIVDVENHISWINANLRLQSVKICDIMQRLSRWYDVEVVFSNTAKRNIHFTGYLPRYTNIAEVLNTLELASNVSFEVKGRIVTVK